MEIKQCRGLLLKFFKNDQGILDSTFAFLGASTPWVYALAVALAGKGARRSRSRLTTGVTIFA